MLAGCASSRPSGLYDDASRKWIPTAERIEAALADPKYDDAIWAVLVVDLEAGTRIYGWNEGMNMIPASNMKLYTTASVLDRLGPDYTYTTRVVTDGTVTDGTLSGNLYIVGSGDPVIGGRYNDGNILKTFEDWADSLSAAGISRIQGNIVGDDRFFDDTRLGPGWMWDDESYWYSAEVSALSLNDNTIDLTAEGTRPGQPARLSWEPVNTPYVTVFNNSITVPADSSGENIYSRRRASNIIDIDSEVPAGGSVTRYISISDPTRYFVTVLSETLERNGIQVSGHSLDIDQVESAPDYGSSSMRTIATHESVPMSEIAKAINKPSHNLYADIALKTLAAEHNRDAGIDRPGNWADGIGQVMQTLNRAGADTLEVRLFDGSGLSRYNLVTAEVTMDLLMYMWNHEDRQVFSAFYESLPVGGIDGTLEGRYSSGHARGNVRAKTGTVSYVSSLSGFVNSADGSPLAFSIMANHFSVPTSQVRATQDLIVEQLANMQLPGR